MRVLIAAFAMLVASQPVAASGVYETGESLVKACRAYLLWRRDPSRNLGPAAEDASRCYGYAMGVHDAMSMTRMFPTPPFGLQPICLPSGINGHTLTELLANSLDSDPREQNYVGALVPLRAWAKAYPCR